MPTDKTSPNFKKCVDIVRDSVLKYPELAKEFEDSVWERGSYALPEAADDDPELVVQTKKVNKVTFLKRILEPVSPEEGEEFKNAWNELHPEKRI